MEINKLFDHTILGIEVRKEQIEKLVNEAKENKFFSVCIPPTWIKYTKELLKGSDVKITTVISFPHGNDTTKTKVFATKDAIKNGADEIDMVVNMGFLKDGRYDFVRNDIAMVKKACKKHILKVIIETSRLTPEEIKLASKLCLEAKADFVKTSTGFDTRGASFEDIKLIKEVVKDNALIKASGGIKNLAEVREYVKLGANRIGASKGVLIMQELKEEK